MIKICKHCGREFHTKDKRVHHCSKECYKRYNRVRALLRYYKINVDKVKKG